MEKTTEQLIPAEVGVADIRVRLLMMPDLHYSKPRPMPRLDSVEFIGVHSSSDLFDLDKEESGRER